MITLGCLIEKICRPLPGEGFRGRTDGIPEPSERRCDFFGRNTSIKNRKDIESKNKGDCKGKDSLRRN